VIDGFPWAVVAPRVEVPLLADTNAKGEVSPEIASCNVLS
jgi:hypothetical protein